MKRFRDLDFDAIRAANRKQALVPEGSHVIYPAGTAPVSWCRGPRRSWCCRGRRASCTRCGRRRSRRRPSRTRSARGTTYEQQTLRLFGIPESEIAETLRAAEEEVEGFGELEITTCLRRAEVEVVTRWEPARSRPGTRCGR